MEEHTFARKMNLFARVGILSQGAPLTLVTILLPTNQISFVACFFNHMVIIQLQTLHKRYMRYLL